MAARCFMGERGGERDRDGEIGGEERCERAFRVDVGDELAMEGWWQKRQQRPLGWWLAEDAAELWYMPRLVGSAEELSAWRGRMRSSRWEWAKKHTFLLQFLPSLHASVLYLEGTRMSQED